MSPGAAGAMQAAVDSLPELVDAPPVSANDWANIKRVVEEASKRFDAFEKGEGHIKIEQAEKVTDEAWGIYRVGNEAIANSARKREVAKVHQALTNHRDQYMYWDQFKTYFTVAAEAVARYRAKNSQKFATSNAMGRFHLMEDEEGMLTLTLTLTLTLIYRMKRVCFLRFHLNIRVYPLSTQTS